MPADNAAFFKVRRSLKNGLSRSNLSPGCFHAARSGNGFEIEIGRNQYDDFANILLRIRAGRDFLGSGSQFVEQLEIDDGLRISRARIEKVERSDH